MSAAGCAGNCRDHDARGSEEALGLLEMLCPSATRWASLESQATLAGVRAAPTESASSDEEAATSSSSTTARRRPTTQRRVDHRLHEGHLV